MRNMERLWISFLIVSMPLSYADTGKADRFCLLQHPGGFVKADAGEHQEYEEGDE
jgi:hypothetical protein